MTAATFGPRAAHGFDLVAADGAIVVGVERFENVFEPVGGLRVEDRRGFGGGAGRDAVEFLQKLRLELLRLGLTSPVWSSPKRWQDGRSWVRS